jgi:hypothetical protein
VGIACNTDLIKYGMDKITTEDVENIEKEYKTKARVSPIIGKPKLHARLLLDFILP